ncbi:uncharacterized protein AMSG_06910 [Thecamonas trahens ATCC 50062]|uniref:THUMP domain-containing protein n=1 Tax=Thecamonas trahens ATCC 50062 TaxID=461836 RepID=A0A0L0DGF1_THETB|nr:hypothetical protein AMSG_06910 [Thecamonas trahens ATCC 50062]KNC50418.1 hypothetical protein AMSG_06910 [Thecamonas trahens ATCC 50062]|eukprot:XP_013756960.1 hypothetical protein AMSG_06910 [Thecamonas trahens ATCC 50062]
MSSSGGNKGKREAGGPAGSGPARKKKKHNKSYYTGGSKRGAREEWADGDHGVLMTCETGVMGLAVRSGKAYLHSRYADWVASDKGKAWAEAHPLPLVPRDQTAGGDDSKDDSKATKPSSAGAPSSVAKEDNDDGGEIDFEAAMDAEFEALAKKDKLTFRNLETKVKGTFFVGTQPTDPFVAQPDGFINFCFDAIASAPVNGTQYISRIVPVHVTTKPKLERIVAKTGALLTAWLEHHPQPADAKFTVIVKRRINKNVDRTKLTSDLVGLGLAAGFTLEWKRGYDFAISVDIILNMAAISILSGYDTYHKYNIQAAVNAAMIANEESKTN